MQKCLELKNGRFLREHTTLSSEQTFSIILVRIFSTNSYLVGSLVKKKRCGPLETPKRNWIRRLFINLSASCDVSRYAHWRKPSHWFNSFGSLRSKQIINSNPCSNLNRAEKFFKITIKEIKNTINCFWKENSFSIKTNLDTTSSLWIHLNGKSILITSKFINSLLAVYIIY